MTAAAGCEITTVLNEFDSLHIYLTVPTDSCLRCFISVATDAHISNLIGHFEQTKILLEEVHFPEELIAGLNKESFLKALKESGIKGQTVN